MSDYDRERQTLDALIALTEEGPRTLLENAYMIGAIKMADQAITRILLENKKAVAWIPAHTLADRIKEAIVTGDGVASPVVQLMAAELARKTKSGEE